MNEELVRLIKENPELEVKFMISGESNEDYNMWYVSTIQRVEKGIYIEYGDRVWDNITDVKDMISDEIYDNDTYNLSNEAYETLVENKFKELVKQEVIFIYVGI